jgi:cupin 2 domain-containing protein
MNRDVRNLHSTPPGESEEVYPLLSGESFRLESIASHGESSPPDFWYDQNDDEWVALLRGSATLEFDDGEILPLTSGDFLLIEAHKRHKVQMASEDAVWLALHFKKNSSNQKHPGSGNQQNE